MKYLIVFIGIFQGFLYSKDPVDSKKEALQEYNSIEDEGTKEGKTEALKDIKRGVYRLKIYGLSRPRPYYYNYVLKVKYNIRVERIAGCRVTSKLVSHAKEYNRIMNIEIKKKYGDDVFLDAKLEARQLSETKRSN